MGASTPGPASDFRPDIEGLRGVAVLLVVLYHANLVGVPGGFVGVDVFFVISGFLITGLLLRERERTGRIGFRAFYARRVRRLLPAGLVALGATLAGVSIALAPLDRTQAMLDGAAAAMSVSNIRFALSASDYFASVASPSPFLHYWSLSVEEQFYLVWPAVLFLAARGRRPRVTAAITLGSLAAVSMAANAWLADTAVSWAFYSLPSRAWQLALGGLLAIAGDQLRRVPRAALLVAGWLGLAALVAASLVFDGDLVYPGVAAVVPTLAAVALITCGTTRLGPCVVLQTRPLRFLGRISYSLYLWHWPILVLPASMLESDPPTAQRMGLVVLAVLLATISWRCIEEPFRAGLPVLARRPGRTILAGGLSVILVVVGASGMAVASSGSGIAGLGILPRVGSTVDAWADANGSGATNHAGLSPSADGGNALIVTNTADAADLPDAGGDGVIVVEIGSPGPALPPAGGSTSGGQAGDLPSPASSASPGVVATAASPTAPTAPPRVPPQPVSWRLPSDVRPSLVDVRDDEERLRGDGCLAFEAATHPPDCVYGDPDGTLTVALIGDSHAAQWFPALNRIANQRGWLLVTYTKVACPFVDMPIYNLSLKREYRECAAWRAAVISRLREQRPDLTLVSGSRFAIHPMRDEDAGVQAQGAALARMLDRIPGRIAVIVDTPEPGEDVPSCLSRHSDDIRGCAIAKGVATSGRLGAIERRATRETGDALIDMTRRVCPAWPCQVVGDGIIKFRDIRHLTATFSRSMAADLDRALTLVLGATIPPSR
jgi:peptidoglycan/LPS O-acetylase OafA/YrhL